MSALSPVYSCASLSASSPVSRWSCMARIASACIRVRLVDSLASGSFKARRRISAETSMPIKPGARLGRVGRACGSPG